MKIMLTSSLIVLLVILCSCNQNKRDKSQAHIDFIDSVEIVLSKKVPELIKEYNVPCLGIGLIEEGKIKYVKVFGENQLGKKAPINTIFDIASITKPITAITTLKLINDGRWSLDEPLYPFWVDPDIAEDERHKNITTRYVLSHSAGFKNWRRGKKLTIDFEPGTKFSYSGEGFMYLQRALEKKFQKPLNTIVDSVLFLPQNMNDASMAWHDKIDESRFAYFYDGKGDRYSNRNHKKYNPNAAGGAKITVKDLTNFGIHVMKGAGISKKLFNEMVSPQEKIHNNASQSLGWELVENLPNDEYFISHDGEDPGINTTIILFPKTQKGIIVLTNGDNGRIVSNKIIKSVFTNGDLIINKLYWGREIPKKIIVSDSELCKIEGYYYINGGGSFEFTKKGNSIFAEGGWGIPQYEFFPQSETKFFTTEKDLVFEFIKDKHQNVNSFKLYWNENQFSSGIKTPTEIQLSEEIKEKYTGVYELNPNFDVSITLEDGKLMFHGTGLDKDEIFAESQTKFFFKVADIQIEFFENNNGKFESFILYQGGQESSGKKKN